MAYEILQEGFEAVIRSRLGASEAELTDATINDRMVAGLAEKYVIRRVPEHTAVTDDFQLLLLEKAVISYTCFLLAPTMARRINIEVATIDVKWKKARVDWDDLAKMFLADMEECLLEFSNTAANYPIGGKAQWSTEVGEV